MADLKRKTIYISNHLTTGFLRTFATKKNYNIKNVLASMIPDEVIYQGNDYLPKKFDTAMMFADVSGFTDLSEKYNKIGKGGASKLSQVLNVYIGNMVQEILSHGGDVLKFSGDAFLVIFKVTSSVSIQDAIHEAIDTALIIQKNYGQYETDIGVILRVKIAISAGEVIFSLIGTEKISHYIIVGQPIWDVKAGEHVCSAGDVVVTIVAWQYVMYSEYIWRVMDDRKHYKILEFSENWRAVQGGQNHTSSRYESIDTELNDLDEDVDIKSYRANITAKESFTLRPTVSIALEKSMQIFLRRFMIPPLMNAIDIDEPLEYLTEMRQIVIVFLNLIVKTKSRLEIISIVDKAYRKLCEIVTDHEGIVNKVSLFDKDMMFLVIFGLRGYKHDSESQIGLKCAAEIQKNLSTIPHVMSASIGVTTGMTYCGVVGHALRREYSVISLTVNKAARLMIAYPGKVTCDRETFLNSKMQAKHFTLQEYKELKGLHFVGPIYEFKEILVAPQSLVPEQLIYPLLGRDDILKIYTEEVEDAICLYNKYVAGRDDLAHEAICKTCMLFIGETRQGKTRLLDEIFYRTYKDSINCIRFTLHVAQVRKPYSTILLCLSSPLKINANMDIKMKENRIREVLEHYKIQHFLFVLNPIFDVNFSVPQNFAFMSNYELLDIRRKLFKLICQEIFSKYWVILIDDIEYADEESFAMFDIFFDTMFVFCVLSLGNRRKLSPSSSLICKHSRVCTVKLGPIDKIYLKELACQFLGVTAISLDLEKIIHTRSMGNPGWIDSFLISLIQTNRLNIKKMSVDEAIELGLVFMEKRFMRRDSSSMSQHSLNVDPFGWDMYALAFKESQYEELESKHVKEKLNLDVELIKVGILSSDCSIDDHVIELTMDSINLIIYDSLSSFEQLICKCASVLGEKFLRSMLLFVMATGIDERAVALGIKKLFELKVILCSGGDFSRGNTIFQKRLNIQETNEINCLCINPPIHETCLDLPKYASCGYCRFNSKQFTETIYNLLTNQQKKNFHNRALIYLEQETQKCEACGGGYFPNIMTDKEEFTKYNFTQYILTFSDEENSDIEDDNHVNKSSELLMVQSKNNLSKINVTERDLSFFKLKNNKKYPSILSYAEYDFTRCECNMILYAMYTQILQHCIGAGLTQKMIEAQIEYALVCTRISNIPRAINLLTDALNQLNNFNLEDDNLLIPFLYGRIYTLLGRCHYSLKQIDSSSEFFYKACLIMGFDFPKHDGTFCWIKTQYVFLKIKDYFRNNARYKDKHVYDIADLITDQLSDCFSSMYLLFKNLEQWKLAKLAAFLSLYKALLYNRNFYSLANGFSNVLSISFYLGISEKFYWMQKVSLEIISSINNSSNNIINANCLHAITKMYTALFYCQTIRSNKHIAIDLGYVVLNIAASIRNVGCKWRVIPILLELLNSYKRIPDSVKLLKDIKVFYKQHSDKLGITWYYALCLDVQLDTGFTIVPYKKCEQFYLDECETLMYIKDSSAMRRYYANMWLWQVRNDAWVSAATWDINSQGSFYLPLQDPTVDVFTSLRILEGWIMKLIVAIEARNVLTIVHQETQIKLLFKKIKKSLVISKCHKARFMFLKIYYKQVKKFRFKNIKKLDKALQLARNGDDLLLEEILLHNIKAWKCELNPAIEKFWVNHSDPNEYQEYDNKKELYPFTLPLPKVKFF